MKKNPAAVKLGKIKTAKKAAAARDNGRKGGRPESQALRDCRAETAAAIAVIQQIRAALGDGEGRIMLHDLAEEIRRLKTQSEINHERAENIIAAREKTIEQLRREIGTRACPKCMKSESMSQDIATLNWTCIQCGTHWDHMYAQGWNDAKKKEAVCFACRGEGVYDHEEGGTATCSECGGSGMQKTS